MIIIILLIKHLSHTPNLLRWAGSVPLCERVATQSPWGQFPIGLYFLTKVTKYKKNLRYWVQLHTTLEALLQESCNRTRSQGLNPQSATQTDWGWPLLSHLWAELGCATHYWGGGRVGGEGGGKGGRGGGDAICGQTDSPSWVKPVSSGN